MYCFDDTIIAQASAAGASARGIVRLSGNKVIAAVESFFWANHAEPSRDNEHVEQSLVPCQSLTWDHSSVRSGIMRIQLGSKGKLDIPCKLFYWPHGHGFTGESAVELHLPGAPPILDAVIGAIIESHKARQAEPGEFTLRAFLNGRVDLTQAEAVLGVIDATETKSLDVALKQLAGGMTRPLAKLRTDLLELLADLEAGFDFSEEDIIFVSRDETASRVAAALEQVTALLTRVSRRNQSSVSHRVVLLGEPNAGKSSLYNRVIEQVMHNESGNGTVRQSALVSDIRGTTRDYLETVIHYGGTSILLTDTPGLETGKSDDDLSLDSKSQESTALAAASADLVLFCVDADRLNKDFPTSKEKQFLDRYTDAVLVITKCDRNSPDIVPQTANRNILRTSSATGEGIVALLEAIQHRLCGNDLPCEAVASTAVRCRGILEEARAALESVCLLCRQAGDEAVIASELRIALEKIGLVTGEVHTDDILENIFSRFCVGK